MRSSSRISMLLGTLAVYLVTACAGCAWLQKPREWDGCAIGGGLAGAAAGAASGIVIATRPRNSTTDDTKVAGGLIGAAVGAGIGTVLGHYICDPVIPPPPPRRRLNPTRPSRKSSAS